MTLRNRQLSTVRKAFAPVNFAFLDVHAIVQRVLTAIFCLVIDDALVRRATGLQFRIQILQVFVLISV